MSACDVEWVILKVRRAINDGRANQAYALVCALAHFAK
jgi:hypothetical protein